MGKRIHLFAWMGLFAITMLTYPGVWLGQTDFYYNDIVNLNLPQRQMAAEIWLGGEIPLWNRYAFGGQPLLAAIQSGVLYPLNAIFLWLHPQVALNVSNLLHQFLAGGFMYLFLYGLWRRVLPAWVGGVVYMCSGFIAGHMIHTQMMNAVVWIPLILHFLDQLRKKGAIRYAIGLTLSTTMQILAGHPQVVYYTAIIITLYFLYTCIRVRRAGAAFLLKASAAFGLAGLMSMMQLLPTMGLIKRSFREAVSYEFFSYLPMTIGWLAEVLVLFRNGGGLTDLPAGHENWWELAGYVGIVATALAVAAAIRYWKRDWYTPFFVGLAVIGLVLAMGDLTGTSRVLYHVPVANWFRVPARFILFFDISVAVLAARALVGLQEAAELRAAAGVRKPDSETPQGIGIIGLSLCAAGLFLLAVLVDFVRNQGNLPDWVWFMPAVWLALASAVLLGVKKWPALMISLLVAVIVYDNVTYVRNLSVDFLPPVKDTRIATAPGDPDVPEWIALMQQDRDRFRIASFYRQTSLNRAGRYHLEALNGYDSLYPEVYERMVDMGWSWAPIGRNRQIIDVLNAKYVIAHPETGIQLTTAGVPSWSVDIPTDKPVSSIRFRYQTEGPRNRAPLARVIVTGADGTRDVHEWAAEIKFTNPKSLAKLQIDYTEWRGGLRVTGVEFRDAGNLVIGTLGQQPVLSPPWQERYKDDRVTVYENTAYYPRYWITDTPDDPRVRDQAASIRETNYQQRESTVEVNSDGGWLVLSQLHDPGWVAYIDGVRTGMKEIGMHLSALPVEAGNHQVRFRYEPTEWKIGLMASGAGLVLLVAWWAYARKKRIF